MTAHQQKKLDEDALRAFRNRFGLPLTDDDLAALRFYKPADDSPRCATCTRAARALGGYLPARQRAADAVPVPPLAAWAQFALQADGQGDVDHDGGGAHADRAAADGARPAHRAHRRRRGAHLRHGQPVPPDRHLLAGRASSTSPRTPSSMLYYREARDGQLLEEGITEAGALSSWVAAATSTACTACRCCRSTSTTRCSASSASAT
jgi:pyruvate dehydrogenase E1 component